MIGNLATSMVSTLLRGTSGINSSPAVVEPALTLQLYDIENCPFCRLVREAFTELAIDAQIYPCPKRGERYRPELVSRGGKAQFPYLVDPNTGVEMYESLDIIEYLFETYGQRSLPLKWRAGKLQTLPQLFAREDIVKAELHRDAPARRCHRADRTHRPPSASFRSTAVVSRAERRGTAGSVPGS